MSLPLSALQALRQVLGLWSDGASVALVPQGKELTTRQAADLLHVSRPFLVRNLLGKEIPFEKVGSHHRIRMEDVLAYRERRARKRRRLLDEMTAEAEDMGEYDDWFAAHQLLGGFLIGAHARVAIGENISWSEGLSRYPGGDELTQQLSALLERIASDQQLGEPERALATAKTQAVA
jgi:excisionase family DNA binding protein